MSEILILKLRAVELPVKDSILQGLNTSNTIAICCLEQFFDFHENTCRRQGGPLFHNSARRDNLSRL